MQELAYDSSGNITRSSESADDSFEVGYAYNVAGDMRSLTYPAASPNLDAVTYGYNAIGQLIAVGRPSAELADCFASYTYTASGVIGAAQFNSTQPPVVCRYRYNSPGWISEIASDVFTERLAYWEQPGYDGARYYSGQIAAAAYELPQGSAPGSFSWRMAYDSAGGLRAAENTADASWNVGTGGNPLLYDANGNMRSFNDGGTLREFTYYTGTNQLRAIGRGTDYTYDRDGQSTGTGIGQELAYDPTTGLTISVKNADRLLTIQYGPEGARRLKTLSDRGTAVSSRRYLVGAFGEPLVEISQGAEERRLAYVWAPQGLLAVVRPEGEASRLTDHLNSTRVVIGTGREIFGAYSYRPFGDPMGEPFGTRPDLLSYLFSGQELDPETGLYNFRARLYDPSACRFLSVDPQDRSADSSPYTFVNNDPVNCIDPDGETLLFLAGLLIAVVIAKVVVEVAGAAGYGIQIAQAHRDFDWGEFGISVGIDAASGFVDGGIGSAAGGWADAAAGVSSAGGGGPIVSSAGGGGLPPGGGWQPPRGHYLDYYVLPGPPAAGRLPGRRNAIVAGMPNAPQAPPGGLPGPPPGWLPGRRNAIVAGMPNAPQAPPGGRPGPPPGWLPGRRNAIVAGMPKAPQAPPGGRPGPPPGWLPGRRNAIVAGMPNAPQAPPGGRPGLRRRRRPRRPRPPGGI